MIDNTDLMLIRFTLGFVANVAILFYRDISLVTTT